MIKNIFIESYLIQKSIHNNKILAVIGSLLLIVFLQAMNINSIILGLQLLIPAHIKNYFFRNDQGIMVRWGIYLGFLLLDIILIQPLSGIVNNDDIIPKKSILMGYLLFSLLAILMLNFFV